MRFLILGVLLQGAGNAVLGRDLSMADAFRFEAVAFALAAAGAAVAARIDTDPTQRALEPMAIPARSVIALNTATAITFLSFYLGLVWIPPSVAAGVEAGVAAAVALLAGGRRAQRRQWLLVGLLLVASTAFGVVQSHLRGVHAGALLGMAMASMAGAAMAWVSILSHDLTSRGVRTRAVLAARYHLTYLVAGAVALALSIHDPAALKLGWSSMLVLALLAVVAPLTAYQIGLGRTPPVRAMGVMPLVPIVSFVVEAALGHPVTPTACVAVIAVVALAVAAGRFAPADPAPTSSRLISPTPEVPNA